MGKTLIDKQSLLEQVRQGLQSGVVSEEDIRVLIGAASVDRPPQFKSESPYDQTYRRDNPAQMALPSPLSSAEKVENRPNKLSAVDVMFYVAGIILFATIMSSIAQTWDSGPGSALLHILLSAGVGSGLWSVAYYLHKRPAASEIRQGLVNAIILTGSLSVVAGGFIITNEIIGGFGEVNFIPGAITFALLGAVHLAYDRLVQKHITILMGVVLSVATFPALLFGILGGSDVVLDIWSVVVILSAALLVYAFRVVARLMPARSDLRQSFDSLGAIVILFTMFASSFTEYGIFWIVLLTLSVFSLFYLSIITQQKHLLGKASLFLVVAVLTISFRYFSGGGATLSLIVATLGLLGSAAVASSMNKKYIRQAEADKAVAERPPLNSVSN